MSRRASASWCGIILAVAIAGLVPAFAGVKTTQSQQNYSVPGTTARQLVQYMQSHPFAGDHGGAFANIRPRYTLSTTTKQSGVICRATRVDVSIHFTITLPVATNLNSLSKGVRSAWNSFAGFAKAHEEHHRQSYIGCAERFVANAMKQKAESCGALEVEIRSLFEKAKKVCEQRQSAFDRQQKGALERQSLMKMAGY
jgi:predicted secreted Zn-dependent protease